jgi:hypothetical protein
MGTWPSETFSVIACGAFLIRGFRWAHSLPSGTRSLVGGRVDMILKCLFGYHTWIHGGYGCKCQSCGKTRDEGHTWKAVHWAKPGCKCPECGKLRDQFHQWKGCQCIICGSQRSIADAIGDRASLQEVRALVREEDIPSLIGLLDRGSIVAASLLGEIGDSRAIKPLATLLQTGGDYSRAAAAESLGKLGDPSVLSTLTNALGDPWPDVRAASAAAIVRLSKERSLRPDVRERIKNEIIQLITEWSKTRHDFHGLDALVELGWEDLLAGIAICSKERPSEFPSADRLTVAEKSISRISRAELLLKIIADGDQEWVRISAARRLLAIGGTLSDRSLLLSLVKTSQFKVNYEAGCMALKQLAAQRDSQGLYDVSMMNSLVPMNLRLAAVENIHDQTRLASIATQCHDRSIRRMATERLENQQVLQQIATTESAWEVAVAATIKVTDGSILKALTNRGLWEVRAAAVKNMTDLAALRQVVLTDADGTVCEAAANRLRELGDRDIPPFRKPADDTERLLTHLTIRSSVDGTACVSLTEAAAILNAALKETRSNQTKPHWDSVESTLTVDVHNDPLRFYTRISIFRIGKDEFKETSKTVFTDY